MKRLIATTVVLGAFAFAAFASANVLVFTTKFEKSKDVARIDRLAGGKACDKSRKGKKSLGVRTKAGRKNCLFSTPVEGDSKQPSYVLQTTAKVLKDTNKKIRKQTYVGLALRANAKSAYEFRIFPKGKRFKLLKNGESVQAGKSKDIAPLGKRNLIRFEAIRSDVLARVNGKTVASFRDNSPQEVSGRKTALAFGSEARAKKDAYGAFTSVKAFVPDP